MKSQTHPSVIEEMQSQALDISHAAMRKSQRDNATAPNAQERARAIVEPWLHGDEKHRQWLRDIAEPAIAAALTEAERRGAEEMRERLARDIRRLKMKAEVADRFGTLTVLETIARALSLDGGDRE